MTWLTTNFCKTFIKLDNIGEVASLGADTFVSGSAIFNEDNYQDILLKMREALIAGS